MAFLKECPVGLMFWLFTVTLAASPAQAQQVTEQDIKAVFLYKFTNFVEWPPTMWQGVEPFRFCVAANKEMTAIIARTMKDETVHGRAVEIRPVDAADDALHCHLLFIGETEMARAPALLGAVRDKPVLTVGESEDFLAKGGAIGFVLAEKHVAFDINVGNAKRGGLGMSSRLLRVARRLEGTSR